LTDLTVRGTFDCYLIHALIGRKAAHSRRKVDNLTNDRGFLITRMVCVRLDSVLHRMLHMSPRVMYATS
jgi:hypothetical protein